VFLYLTRTHHYHGLSDRSTLTRWDVLGMDVHGGGKPFMAHLRLRVLWIGTCLDHPSGAGCTQRTPSCFLRVNAELNSRRTKVTAQNVSIPHWSALELARHNLPVTRNCCGAESFMLTGSFKLEDNLSFSIPAKFSPPER
jgi:hypothetical protein